MDTPELPAQPTPDEPPSPESQPPESTPPSATPPEAPTFLTAQAPPRDPNAPLAPDDPLRYWYSTQPPQPVTTTSRPFSEIWKIVWTQPDVMAYRDVLREADTTLRRSVTWLASVWGVAIAAAFLALLLFGADNFNNYDTLQNERFSQDADTQTNAGGVLCIVIICIPILILISIGFYLLLNVGIPHVAAVMMGGTGQYEHTAFLYSAIYAPSVLISALQYFVPRVLALQCIVLLVLLVIGLYSIMLHVIAIKAAHNIGWFQSVVAAFSPLILIIGLVGCCLLLSLGSAANS